MVETVLRIGFSLAIVLGLMWGMAKLVKRTPGKRGGGAMSVLARQQLSRNSSVALVRVADRALILGVTDSQVTMLGETELSEVEKHDPAPAPVPEKEPEETAEAGPGYRKPEWERVSRQSIMLADDTPPGGPLDGSILSPTTWRRTVDFLKDRTARR